MVHEGQVKQGEVEEEESEEDDTLDPNAGLTHCKVIELVQRLECYDFSYFVLFTYVFSLFLEVSHGTATLTHFSLTHIAAILLTHCTAVVLTHSITILIALPH